VIQTNNQGRERSLDGVRGAAALAVFFSHALIVSPSLGRTASLAPNAVDGTALRILAYTPLRLLWIGPEAVVIFFVLSGYVMTLPFMGDRNPNWAAYYGKRLIRLYLQWHSQLFHDALRLRLARTGFDPAVPAGFLERSALVAEVGGRFFASAAIVHRLRTTRTLPTFVRCVDLVCAASDFTADQ
jgi:peptidoglycan/LPS O-acetylase OafA/YrhL